MWCLFRADGVAGSRDHCEIYSGKLLVCQEQKCLHAEIVACSLTDLLETGTREKNYEWLPCAIEDAKCDDLGKLTRLREGLGDKRRKKRIIRIENGLS